jgi:amidase
VLALTLGLAAMGAAWRAGTGSLRRDRYIRRRDAGRDRGGAGDVRTAGPAVLGADRGNRSGLAPLRSGIALNLHALDDGRRQDAERRAGNPCGPLHGAPILSKDNIDIDDGTANTVGSRAPKDNVTGREAPAIDGLNSAGEVILGKINLSEWTNISFSHAISGWSSVGGLVRNPYAMHGSACGSSTGTGAALAAAGVGSETDGASMSRRFHTTWTPRGR